MIDYSAVGKRIRYYRRKKGITQEQLAFDIETSASYLSNIERAVKKPSLEKVAQIADALGISVEDLIYSSSTPYSSRPADSGKKVILCPKTERDRLLNSLYEIIDILNQ